MMRNNKNAEHIITKKMLHENKEERSAKKMVKLISESVCYLSYFLNDCSACSAMRMSYSWVETPCLLRAEALRNTGGDLYLMTMRRYCLNNLSIFIQFKSK